QGRRGLRRDRAPPPRAHRRARRDRHPRGGARAHHGRRRGAAGGARRPMTAPAPTALPPALAEALAEQPAARLALAAALGAPSHAYLFAGAPGSGKRAAARAFAAELLADGAEDPDSARRRALADPSPHPDLTW